MREMFLEKKGSTIEGNLTVREQHWTCGTASEGKASTEIKAKSKACLNLGGKEKRFS